MREEEFEQLYTEHAEGLYAFLVYRTGDRVLAEDMMADAFERAFRARFRFDPRKASRKTWLYAIALNQLRDHARRSSAQARALGRVEPPSPEDWIERVDDRDAVQRALTALSAEEREAVALRYGAELTFPEIATLQRQPLTTVEARVYRALRKMRAVLANSPIQP